jgi:hypothetical protein
MGYDGKDREKRGLARTRALILKSQEGSGGALSLAAVGRTTLHAASSGEPLRNVFLSRWNALVWSLWILLIWSTYAASMFCRFSGINKVLRSIRIVFDQITFMVGAVFLFFVFLFVLVLIGHLFLQ